MKTLGFYPHPVTPGNDYTDLILEAILKADDNVTIKPFSHYKVILNGGGYDIVWLNWFETMSQSLGKFIYEIIAKIYIINFLKFRNIKIITVFHDRIPHDAKFSGISKWFLKFLLSKSDVILVLNEESKNIINEYIGEKKEKKIFKLPHPSYPGENIPEVETSRDFNVLFFGNIKPYKNIEGLIELAKINPDIKFTIAGKPINKKYGETVRKLCGSLPNVKLILKFLSNEEIDNLIEGSSILVLPYKLKSSINSGVMFYAFSNNRNVIIPKIAAVDEFENKDDIYWYEYKSDEEHINILNKELLKAYKDYTTNPELYLEKTRRLKKEVDRYTVDYLSQLIKELKLI